MSSFFPDFSETFFTCVRKLYCVCPEKRFAAKYFFWKETHFENLVWFLAPTLRTATKTFGSVFKTVFHLSRAVLCGKVVILKKVNTFLVFERKKSGFLQSISDSNVKTASFSSKVLHPGENSLENMQFFCHFRIVSKNVSDFGQAIFQQRYPNYNQHVPSNNFKEDSVLLNGLFFWSFWEIFSEIWGFLQLFPKEQLDENLLFLAKSFFSDFEQFLSRFFRDFFTCVLKSYCVCPEKWFAAKYFFLEKHLFREVGVIFGANFTNYDKNLRQCCQNSLSPVQGSIMWEMSECEKI